MSLVKTMVSAWQVLAALLSLTAMILIASCNKQEKLTGPQAQVAQRTFASPEDAAKALVEAAQSNSRDAMLTILGAGSEDIIYSGDATQE